VISLMQKIESAFNFVWHINSLRSIGQRFSNYLSVVLVGPVLVFTAMGLTATLMSTNAVKGLQSVAPLGWLMESATKLTPYVLVWIAFTFIYGFVPNTRVRVGPAAAGALVAAFAWQTSGWGFAAFVASSARFPDIYSSFAILILLLIWLYLNWFILLLGAQISFYFQNPRYITLKQVHLRLSNRLKERLGLGVMFLISSHHYHNRGPWTLDGLVAHLDMAPDPINRLLVLLHDAGFVERTASEPPAYLPARDIETILVLEVLAALRQAGETDVLQLDHAVIPKPVDGTLDKARAAVADELGELSLRDLVLEEAESVATVHPLDDPAPGRLSS
jgi:membrane protein